MKRALGILAVVAITATLGHATTTFSYSFFPSNSSGDANLGGTFVFSSNSVDIVAAGFFSNGAGGYNLSDLYIKNDGGDEKGIGLNADPSGDHEITSKGFVLFDLSNLWAFSPTSFTMAFGSTTLGETWNVYGSNTPGTLGTLLKSGTSESTITFSTIPTAYQYLDVTASGPAGANVTVQQIVATVDGGAGGITAAPEPATYALLGAGLVLLGLLKKRANPASGL